MAEVQALQRWVAGALTKINGGRQAVALQPLHGDAGLRRYFRIDTAPGLLAVMAPPDRAHNQEFVALADALQAEGIRTPRIVASAAEHGFMLLEDFGDRLLADALDADSATGLYGEALMTLLRLQQCPRPDLVAAYDEGRLLDEMALFRDWFVPRLLGHALVADEQALLEDVFQLLIDSAAGQPRALVHRDYHSRNLIICAGGDLGVIDFQGALWGPFTYDLVSLLKDCYVRWDPDQVRRWALAYGDMLIEADIGVMPGDDSVTREQFLRWFDLMGLQRHIKVLGIFARLHLRDGKAGYLNDLPLVIRYVLEAAARYPELAAFGAWFERRLLPLCATQPWYRDYRQAGDLQ
ncbi:aminoglycoside phosphotransferase family protein [Exilibacterium tricleocarpae]|nr:phosphotransferase [Exilibacterium tricleocarpae]